MAALEAADAEADALAQHARACAAATARWKERRAAFAEQQAAGGSGSGGAAHVSLLSLPLTAEDIAADAAGPTLPAPPKANVALLGRTPSAHVLSALFAVKAHELETSLLVLPFRHVAMLVKYVAGWLREPWLCAGDGREVELAARSLFFLLRAHERQLCANRSLRATLLELGGTVRTRLEDHRDRVGYNLHGVRFWQRYLDDASVRQLKNEDAEAIAAGAAFAARADAKAAAIDAARAAAAGAADGGGKRQRVDDDAAAGF